MKRGDIVLVELPEPIGSPGNEQFGNRPALLIHADSTLSQVPVLMVVPFSAQLAAQRFPHTIVIQPSIQNGLSQPSVILVFQLRAIDRHRIKKVIGTLESQIMVLIESELKKLLAI